MSNYIPLSSANNNCTVCHQLCKLGRQCFFCPQGSKACMNKCMVRVTNQDAEKFPTLKQAINQYVCLNCLKVLSPKPENDITNNTVYALSENYIRTLFAQIFEPENVEIDTNENILEDSKNNTPPENQIELYDSLIKAVFADLAIHNNIKFDENGKLSEETKRYFTNSIKQSLLYSIIV